MTFTCKSNASQFLYIVFPFINSSTFQMFSFCMLKSSSVKVKSLTRDLCNFFHSLTICKQVISFLKMCDSPPHFCLIKVKFFSVTFWCRINSPWAGKKNWEYFLQLSDFSAMHNLSPNIFYVFETQSLLCLTPVHSFHASFPFLSFWSLSSIHIFFRKEGITHHEQRHFYHKVFYYYYFSCETLYFDLLMLLLTTES